MPREQNGAGNPILNTFVESHCTGNELCERCFSGFTGAPVDDVPPVLRQLGIVRSASGQPGRLYVRNIGERLARWGGSWASSSGAGACALGLPYAPTYSD